MDKKEQAIVDKLQELMKQLNHKEEVEDNMDIETGKLSKLLQLSKVTSWEYDPSTNTVFYLEGSQQKTYPNGRSLSLLTQPLDSIYRKMILECFRRLLEENSKEETFTYAEPTQDGCHWYEVHACAYQSKILGTTRFLHHEDEQVKEAVQAKQRFELLMSIANVFVWEYDVQKEFFSANESLCQKLGLQHRNYAVEELSKILKIDLLKSFVEDASKQQAHGNNTIHITNRREDTHLIFETNFSSIQDEEGNNILILGTLFDITEQELLKNKASRDDLTGCYNRGSADVTLSNTYQRFKEDNEQYTIIFFDIDKFKDYNDNMGHDAGDYVLKRFSGVILQEIRSSDRLFRWGGDEFLLICSGIAKENMYSYVDRLRRVIECTDFSYGGKKLQVTTSIGAAYYYKTDKSFADAMKRADRSVYKSKLAGRNNACMLLK